MSESTSVDFGSIIPDAAPPQRRRWVLHTAGVVLFLVLAALTSWVWIEYQRHFPILQTGSYAGVIQWKGQVVEAVPWYVERIQSSEIKLVVTLFDERWSPVAVAIPITEAPDVSSWPVVSVRGAITELRFSGFADSNGRFRGTVFDIANNRQGSWDLSPVVEAAGPSKSALPEIPLWISLSEELAAIEKRVADAESMVPKQSQEIERLTQLITDKGALRARADQKLQEVSQSRQALRDQVLKQRREARKLEEKIDISLKVLPMGRLASMSRETLAREGQWFQASGALGDEVVSDDVQAAYQRGLAILELRQKILDQLSSRRLGSGDAVDAAAVDNPEL